MITRLIMLYSTPSKQDKQRGEEVVSHSTTHGEFTEEEETQRLHGLLYAHRDSATTRVQHNAWLQRGPPAAEGMRRDEMRRDEMR